MQKLIKLLSLAVLALSMFGAGAAHAQSTTIITAGGQMVPDQHYFSPDGKFFAVFQGFDGNLVVYRGPDRTAAGVVWASGARQGTIAIMQYDSNFVIYKGTIHPSYSVWASGTNNSANTGGSLTIGNDGALRVLNGSGTLVWNSTPGVAPPCVPGPYSVCVRGGTPFQYQSTVWACSWAQASQLAFASGGTLGICYF